MANWKYTLDVAKEFNNEDLQPNELAKIFADKIENLQKNSLLSENLTLKEIHKQFLDASKDEDLSNNGFDYIFERLYNFADMYRIWVKTF